MSKVLLVEDDNNLREIFEMRLKAEGYETVTAGDGEEALMVAMREKPDLIIADVMMPKLSGFEMLETLRASPEMRDTKVFMMTALGQAEDRARGEKLGVVKYLVKSQVTLEDFVRVVREVLQPGPTGVPEAPPAQAAAVDSEVNNNQESEHYMPEDTNPQTNPVPSTPPAEDSAAPSTSPAGDTSASGGVADSGQMSTAEEQSTVDSQINDFVSSTPSEPAAGSDASNAPAVPPSDSSSTESPDVPVTSAPGSDESAQPASGAPSSTEGSDTPSEPSPSSGL